MKLSFLQPHIQLELGETSTWNSLRKGTPPENTAHKPHPLQYAVIPSVTPLQTVYLISIDLWLQTLKSPDHLSVYFPSKNHLHLFSSFLSN